MKLGGGAFLNVEGLFTQLTCVLALVLELQTNVRRNLSNVDQRSIWWCAMGSNQSIREPSEGNPLRINSESDTAIEKATLLYSVVDATFWKPKGKENV